MSYILNLGSYYWILYPTILIIVNLKIGSQDPKWFLKFTLNTNGLLEPSFGFLVPNLDLGEKYFQQWACTNASCQKASPKTTLRIPHGYFEVASRLLIVCPDVTLRLHCIALRLSYISPKVNMFLPKNGPRLLKFYLNDATRIEGAPSWPELATRLSPVMCWDSPKPDSRLL